MAKMSLQSALDLADTLARAMASVITMRRASWLQNSGIALNVQQAIEGLAFQWPNLVFGQD